MTVRRFVMWYLGTVLFAATTAASSYQALQRLHANDTLPAPSMSVAQANTPSQASEVVPESNPAQAAPALSLPKLRPPLPMVSKATASNRKRAVAARPPARRPTTIASAHRQPRVDGPWAYPPPPPPPGYGYYAYPARYPYPGYDPYYPPYGYYRTF